jgi:hypothetical protein
LKSLLLITTNTNTLPSFAPVLKLTILYILGNVKKESGNLQRLYSFD